MTKYIAEIEADGKIKLDLNDLAEAMGIPHKEVEAPIGRIRADLWKPEDLPEVLRILNELNPDGRDVHIYGMSTVWVLAAMVCNNMDKKFVMWNGMFKSDFDLYGLPVSSEVPADNIGYIWEQRGNTVYIEGYGPSGPGQDAHNYDFKKLPTAVVPMLPEGTDVCFKGVFGNPVVVAIMQGLCRRAGSVSLKSHSDPGYVCIYSAGSNKKIGDVTADPE